MFPGYELIDFEWKPGGEVLGPVRVWEGFWK
jgi:hypothetical protein